MLSDLKRNIDQISRERGIERGMLIAAIEEAVLVAVRKKIGQKCDLEAQYSEEYGDVAVIRYRKVVEEVEDEDLEISYEYAKEQEPDIQIGEELGEHWDDIDVAGLGRIAAQSAKQVIIQKMKSAEQKVVYDMFKEQVGSVVSGIVQRFDRGNMIVNLGRTDAILPREEQIPKRSYKQGDRIRAYLKEVREGGRDAQLILSRTCDEFLEQLFLQEVPEMQEGVVKLMAVSREPGFRAKIAVSSTESDVDPVGACVGMRGARVQNVVQELQGERIDIVTWSPDPAKYVYNALAPAHVTMVRTDEENNSLLVIVPNDQLTLAIGRQGQNVRLASQLMGWSIDVKSEQRYENLQNPAYCSLLKLPGIDENTADQLFNKGITSLAVLAETSPADLSVFRSIDEDFAALLISEAERLLASGEVVIEESSKRKEMQSANISESINGNILKDGNNEYPEDDESNGNTTEMDTTKESGGTAEDAGNAEEISN